MRRLTNLPGSQRQLLVFLPIGKRSGAGVYDDVTTALAYKLNVRFLREWRPTGIYIVAED